MKIDGSERKMSDDLCAPATLTGANLGSTTLNLDSTNIPSKLRNKLRTASVAYSWANGWLLLSKPNGGDIFCCFNPKLPSPVNYIPLPSSYFTGMIRDKGPDAPPIKAGFSAVPTHSAQNWTLLVVGGRRNFSTFTRGEGSWRNYNFALPSEEGRLCVGVGYLAATSAFFCLFERGDVLIFSTDGSGPHKMLTAAPPLTQARLYGSDEIDVLDSEAVGKGLVLRWRRDEGGDNFRLMGVERRPTAAEEEAEAAAAGGKVVGTRAEVRAEGRTIEGNSVNGVRCRILKAFCVFVVATPCFYLLFTSAGGGGGGGLEVKSEPVDLGVWKFESEF